MRITNYLIGGLAALALVGCKDKMRELNTNPSTIGETDPRYMFLNAVANLDYGRSNAVNSFGSEGVMMQYFVRYNGATENTYGTVGRYPAPGQIGNWYNSLYSVGYKMSLLQSYIDDNLTETEALQYQDLRAIAGIVKVFEAFRVFQNYGAAVYSQAFKAITEGITKPVYDIFSNEVYESLDDELVSYIAVLAQNLEGQSELGIYDPIYGYKANAAMGAPETRGDYDAQRTLWKKFANSYRLYMAWIMKAVDEARFNDVLAQTNGQWFETAADGAYVYLNGPKSNGDAVYNSNDVSAISVTYSLTDNFVSYLKLLDDPRLPLLARANGLYAENKSIQWIQAYFPDSLVQHWVYDEDLKTWEQKPWGDVLNFQDDPTMAYQGQSPNAANNDIAEGPERFWNQRTFTFRFYHPNYTPGDAEANKKLEPWTVTNDGSIIPNTTKDFPATKTIIGPDTSVVISVVSRPQGRYFTSCGGRAFGDATDNAGNGYDGSVADWANIYLRHPLYTYPEFCFMMAYLTVDGVSTGKDAAEWYESGVTEAMKELQADAIRCGVQVATNKGNVFNDIVVNPKIEGINDDGVYSITDKIAGYVAAQALGNATDQKEAIVGQMWIYAYNQPIKMWDWWRLTGYPTIKEVATPADRPTGLYWVQPQNLGGDVMLEFPRRGALPGVEAINNDNYNAARDELITQPNYGQTYSATTGRIFWDVQGL